MWGDKQKSIEDLYRTKYPFYGFYNIINERLNINRLLQSHVEKICRPPSMHEEINTVEGDIRVDLPVSLGNYDLSNLKIVFMGLEPRDSNKKFNIEKVENFIFGSPFGLELWAETNKYYKSFAGAIGTNKFCYFTDVVKYYEVKKDKATSDKTARSTFWEKASSPDNIGFLIDE